MARTEGAEDKKPRKRKKYSNGVVRDYVSQGKAQKQSEEDVHEDLHAFKNSLRRKGYSQGNIFHESLKYGDKHSK